MKYNYENNTKLRIVLLLDNETKEKILTLNKEFSKDILFDENCIPHITLISGILKNKKDFEKSSKIINNLTDKYFKEKLTINFNEFYFSPDNTWLFLGLENNVKLLSFINELRINLAPYFQISDARHLHVTLAKNSELKTKVEINNLQIPQGFIAENIAIGLSGTNGILLNLIEKIKIKSAKNNLLIK